MLNLLNRKSNSIVNNKIGNLEKIGDWKNIRNEENLKKKHFIQYYPCSNKE